MLNNDESYYEKDIANKEFGLCSICKLPLSDETWCKHCSSQKFEENFNKWTSRNEHIDEFIQSTQSVARNHHEVTEWIPYNKLRNIQYLSRGGFSTIYKAIWLDGYIEELVVDGGNGDKKWKRHKHELEQMDHEIAKKEKDIVEPLKENEKEGIHVVLKSLDNSSNIHEDFLNEVSSIFYYINTGGLKKNWNYKTIKILRFQT